MTPRLTAAREATRYQKEWFLRTARLATEGRPIALVNADAPHEILRALDIPYVVNQWWASIISAKQAGPAALRGLAERGLPDTSAQYDAMSLGEQFLAADERPWGGLPRPDFVIAERMGDTTQKVFELWGDLLGSEVHLLDRTAADPAPSRWWELVGHDWERVFGAPRIDLLAEQIRELIAALEERTGRRLDMARLAEIMAAGNEQAEWNRRTRDLLAGARPTPVAIADILPAVMVPQWHRGTRWAVDAARRLHDELAERVAQGFTPYRDERLRLMWIGRGLWNDIALYDRAADQHGAVFVWSMYLAIAADGYARYGDDPVRALAARFVGLTDLLYVSPFASEWYAHQAAQHDIDGVVHLVADDTPGGRFITDELGARGIPVLEIRANNADSRSSGEAGVQQRIDDFIRSLGGGRGRG